MKAVHIVPDAFQPSTSVAGSENYPSPATHLTLCLYVYVCVFLYFLHVECQTMHSTSKGRTFLGSEDILAGPQRVLG